MNINEHTVQSLEKLTEKNPGKDGVMNPDLGLKI
jgi:hypothetical protein